MLDLFIYSMSNNKVMTSKSKQVTDIKNKKIKSEVKPIVKSIVKAKMKPNIKPKIKTKLNPALLQNNESDTLMRDKKTTNKTDKNSIKTKTGLTISQAKQNVNQNDNQKDKQNAKPNAKPKAKPNAKPKAKLNTKLNAKPKAKLNSNIKSKPKEKPLSKKKLKQMEEMMRKKNNINNLGDFKKLFEDTQILKYTSNKQQDDSIFKVNPSIWVDKYRPRKLDDVIGHDDIKNVIKNALISGDLPHMLFYGMPGTGKTSITHAMVRELYGKSMGSNVLELNASDENGINVVRDKIIRFASLETSKRTDESPEFKVIILDEADSMTSEAQTALKKAMEKTCKITRFVIICNYENKIIDAIRSRCASFRFNPITDDKMIEKLKEIAKSENMVIKDDNIYKKITDICEGDARRSINTLQNLKYVPKFDTISIDTYIENNRNLPKNVKNDIYKKIGKCPNKIEGPINISIKDVDMITSSIDYDYFTKYWNKIVECPTADALNDIAHSIVIEGYPMDFVLKFFKDSILKCGLTDRNKSDVLLFIANVERMLTNGAGNHIQTLAVITLISSKFKKVDIRVPDIF